MSESNALAYCAPKLKIQAKKFYDGGERKTLFDVLLTEG
jgi:hypothetical protein